ncbi:MAG: acetoacetyl-CoA synthetase, partial [Acidimicrobiaceae bacterium]|nr:acetoacetyl-CoA synthetase [Acidimicrobiaceae bacterium]
MVDRPLWTPSPERVAAANLTAFAEGVGLEGYDALHHWSVTDLDGFWSALWDATGMIGDKGATIYRPGADLPGACFFPDARLSLAENLMARTGDAAAIIALDETGRRREWSWDELRRAVGSLAADLQADGVGPGSRVAAWLPNIPEAVAAMIATVSLGGVFTSASPDFGVDGLLDRFGQVEPTVLFAADGYWYGGKPFDCRDRLAELRARLPTLTRVYEVPNLEAAPPPPRHAPLPSYERRPFDHPWYVLYSSGTTGQPKGIVHRAGGVLLQHRKEHQLHNDLRPGDRAMYFTTTGWMMWNWLVSALATGVTIVLFDGSPFHPSPDVLLDAVDAEQITLFGVSAKYLDSLKKAGLTPARSHSLASVRTICSTGSPLVPETFVWVYENMKADVHLASMSGGTDLCGCFVGGDPTGAVFAGELQRPGLGMAVDVFDGDGQSLRDRPGERGELVCTAAFPSIPLEFWNDADGRRLRAAYFERFAGAWAHGDFASWTEHDGMVIHGRSDATLNPGGVRIGTAEIYRIVEQLPPVAEALAFGQNVDGDVRIVLLVRMGEGYELTDEVRAEIKQRIRIGCSPRHVPAVIVDVDDLPRTRS